MFWCRNPIENIKPDILNNTENSRKDTQFKENDYSVLNELQRKVKSVEKDTVTEERKCCDIHSNLDISEKKKKLQLPLDLLLYPKPHFGIIHNS